MAEGGLHPGPHRRRVLRHRGRAAARQEVQARHRGGRRPHVVREGIEPRLADSFETALLAEGLAYLDPADPQPSPNSSRA